MEERLSKLNHIYSNFKSDKNTNSVLAHEVGTMNSISLSGEKDAMNDQAQKLKKWMQLLKLILPLVVAIDFKSYWAKVKKLENKLGNKMEYNMKNSRYRLYFQKTIKIMLFTLHIMCF